MCRKSGRERTRNQASACDDVKEVSAREKCHIQLAEKNSGLSSDTSTLDQGKTTNSLIMNTASAALAYVMIKGISSVAAKGSNSVCTSKKVLAVTSVAGIASDIFLKMKAKKKVKELEDKYKLETSTGTQEAQVKALEYLREEQVTVKEIASMEKKRNMLLMLGYGMASAWAIYEMTPYGKLNADCMKPASADGNQVAANADLEVAKPPGP
ncbi:MAG: hypothetical protein K2Q18_04045 [Bdellovibrionales bacterium]|nr:hypothetical protein [Bdellovibrionales bacterium]